MCHVESSPKVRLSYLLSPGLLNLFFPKFVIEISSIPKSLGVNIRIQIGYIFIRNSGIVLSKMLKQANLIISRITFCVKKIWSGIRSIINISKVKADYISSILESGKTLDNPCAIANIFDNFFVNVGKNTDKDIPCGNCCPSMFLSPVTSVEVDSYISQMDNNKSIGPYSIPVPLLKIHISHLFHS